MKCKNGHYTSHFELKRGEMFCPVCGSKTAENKSTQIYKTKWKPRKTNKCPGEQQPLF
jgi:uncharacterized Zn finger protein (UPF0148 family)